MSTLLLDQLKEKLQVIENDLQDAYEIQNSSLLKISQYKKVAVIIRNIISYLIVAGAIFFSCFDYNNIEDIKLKEWLTFIVVTFYPGYFGIIFVILFLESPFEFLAHKLAKITKRQFAEIQLKFRNIEREKAFVNKEISDEYRRIKREEEIEKERVRKLTEKEKEYNFLNKIVEAVTKIEKRLISFEDAKLLQIDLEQDFNEIRHYKTYYYHQNKFYRNRLDRIANVLKNYDSPTITTSIVTSKSIKNETKNEYFVPKLNEEEKLDVPTNVKLEPLTNYDNSESSLLPNKKVIEKERELKNNGAKEKLISELFQEKTTSDIRDFNQRKEIKPIKIDYVKLNEQRKTIGFLGEKFILLKYEKDRLEREGLAQYLDSIEHISTIDDSFGYDIKSFNRDGSPRYIEVKTTIADHKSPFFVTENEITAMKNLDNYFIYRVYNFDVSANVGDVVPINCENELEKYFEISPISYKVLPR